MGTEYAASIIIKVLDAASKPLRAIVASVSSLNKVATADASLDKKAIEPITKKYGLDLKFFNSQGQFSGIRNMIVELEKLRVMTQQEQSQVLNQLFGEQAARAMAVFVNQGLEGFDKMQARMDSQKSTQEKVSAIMATITQQWDSLGGTVETFVSKIGGIIAELFDVKSLIAKVNDFVAGINDWIDNHQNTVKVLLKLALASSASLAAVGSVFLSLGTLLTVGGGALASLLGLIEKLGAQSILQKLSIGRIASSLRSILTFLGSVNVVTMGIAAGALLIYKFWKPIKNFFYGLWDGMKAGWNELNFTELIAAWEPLLEPLKTIKEWLTLLLQQEEATASSFQNGFGIAHAAVTKFGQFLVNVYTEIGYVWQAVHGLVAQLGEAAGWIYAFFADGILDSYLTTLQLWFANILRLVAQWWNNLMAQIGSWFNNLYTTLENRLTSLAGLFMNSGAKIVRGLIDGLRSVDISGPVGEVAQKIRNFFPFSPAKEGPLRDLNKVRIVETIAENIKPAPLVKALQAATAELAPGKINAGIPSGSVPLASNNFGGLNITYAPVVTMGNGTGADLMTELRRHSTELAALISREMQSEKGLAFS